MNYQLYQTMYHYFLIIFERSGNFHLTIDPFEWKKMNPNNRVRVDEIHRWSNCATVDPWTNYQIITYMHRKQFFSLFFLIFFHIFSSINYTYRMKVDFSRSIKCFIGCDGLHFSCWLLYKWLSYCDYLQITYWSMKNL